MRFLILDLSYIFRVVILVSASPYGPGLESHRDTKRNMNGGPPDSEPPRFLPHFE